MKIFKIVLFSATFLIAGFALNSCGGHSHDADATEQQGKEYTSAYVCPMHCKDSGSEEAGKCPACGMDYVKNEDHGEDGHDHDSHDNHSH